MSNLFRRLPFCGLMRRSRKTSSIDQPKRDFKTDKRVLTLVGILLLMTPSSAADFGDCTAPVRTEWLDDGRRMRLLEEYRYVDSAEKPWIAPKDSIIDGASIPQFLWSLIGGPFEGPYRKASVVHDVACESKTENWRAVHRMFFDAMQCSGVSEARAQVMYAAVYQCGPRWGVDQGMRLFDCDQPMTSIVRRLIKYVRQRLGLSAEDLEALKPDTVAAIADPIEVLRNSLEGQVEIVETVTSLTVNIGFEFDRYDLSPNAAAVVEKIAGAMKDAPDIRMAIQGHTDDIGTSEYNMTLSERRASSALEALAARGVERGRMRSASYGEETPTSADSTAAARQQNRRVTIVITEEL